MPGQSAAAQPNQSSTSDQNDPAVKQPADKAEQKTRRVGLDMTNPDLTNVRTGRTLYEAGIGEIIWRNFLAGVSRGLGNLILFILFFLILGNLFMTYVWPYMEPIVESFYSTGELVKFIENYVKLQNQ